MSRKKSLLQIFTRDRTSDETSGPTSTLVNRGDCQRKYVFAHFMVGNTYPYNVQDWIEDIELASGHEIDGFALNVGKEDWQKDRISDCYEAALRTNLPFKLFLSFDMTSMTAKCKQDVQPLHDYLKALAHHPNMFRYGDKVVVSTFSGENSLFGLPTLDNAWSYVKHSLEKVAQIHFIPSFFIDPARYPGIRALDGAFNWNGSWPIQLTRDSTPAERHRISDTDHHHLRHLRGCTFMAAVSPWFFTHYGPDSWNKNWIYLSDNWLFVRRWEQLMQMREHIDIVQVISWNDYGESHYIGPIHGAQPNSQAWVDGFPHVVWLHLNSYYARTFKDGCYPPIQKDRIFIWARPHPKGAWAPDKVPRPTHWELTEDVFWVVVFSTAPATVTLSSGDKSSEVEVETGVKCLEFQLTPDSGMRTRMVRNGLVVADCNPIEFRFESKPTVYNFNAFVTMSP